MCRCSAASPIGGNLESRMGLPDDYGERVARYVQDIRYDKMMEAFGGHTEHVTDPDDIRSASTLSPIRWNR